MLGVFILGLTIGILVGRIVSVIAQSEMNRRLFNAIEEIEARADDIIEMSNDLTICTKAETIIRHARNLKELE